MATEDARYRQSSQFRLWSFSPSKLASMRETTNALARASISERLLASNSLPTSNNPSAPTSALNTPEPDGATPTPTPTLPEFLTPAEEVMLVTLYTSELLRAGEHMGLTDEITSTAAALFRRFYVTNSIMTYPPKDMIVVSLFFGCKAEGSFPSVDQFVKSLHKKGPEEILAGEFLLCQSVRFALDVKHPFRALKGATMELRRYGDIEQSRIEEAERHARDILRFSPHMTDAYFHYTPSQIMLAALSLADRGLAERLIQATFHYVAPSASNDSDTSMANSDIGSKEARREAKAGEDKAAIIGSYVRDKVLGTIEACRDMLSKELPDRKDHWSSPAVVKVQFRPTVRKLAKCHDPDRWDLVALQRRRREQVMDKADSEDGDPEARTGTAAAAKATVDSDAAVFGGALEPRDTKRRKVLDDPFGGPL
ncbi:cyclin-like protein [Podospora appendiculata]|uniref:Cyclin-like protein n=1 Tax=Podospora appendiculata TaxID=314037 RepID=A0AAE0X554_9PEZI|nr:cyclin-like protein [Podospora appendiculata]